MSRYLDEILRLDPVADHKRIVYLNSCYEFPWDTTRSLEFALFRTYCVPSISKLLDATGEFGQRAQKRYDDTDIIVCEMMEWGYDSDRGKRALRRMNQLHGRFKIQNDDFKYVLSTFVFEPIRWNARFGWRPFVDKEKVAYFQFWKAVGERMNIKELPDAIDAFEKWNVDYERDRFVYDDANNRIGSATRELFASWFPRPFAPLVRVGVYALMDEPLQRAFGFPRAPALVRAAAVGGLKARALFEKVMPARRNPRLRTETKHRTYPEGYVIEELGPPSAQLHSVRPERETSP